MPPAAVAAAAPAVVACTPVYFAEEAALPAPSGVCGKSIATEKTPMVQWAEKNRVLNLIAGATD